MPTRTLRSFHDRYKKSIYEETTNIVIDDMADQTDEHMHFSSSLCKVRVKIQNKILIYTDYYTLLLLWYQYIILIIINP